MTQQTRQPARNPPKLCLLGGFSLVVNGSSVALPIHAQRVLAYLSIVQPRQPTHLRAGLAELLWAGASAERSHASLRTALWRIRQAHRCLVNASREMLRLDEAVDVDVLAASHRPVGCSAPSGNSNRRTPRSARCSGRRMG
jgi:DNA-binding SARP family transcriptional activator